MVSVQQSHAVLWHSCDFQCHFDSWPLLRDRGSWALHSSCCCPLLSVNLEFLPKSLGDFCSNRGRNVPGIVSFGCWLQEESSRLHEGD